MRRTRFLCVALSDREARFFGLHGEVEPFGFGRIEFCCGMGELGGECREFLVVTFGCGLCRCIRQLLVRPLRRLVAFVCGLESMADG